MRLDGQDLANYDFGSAHAGNHSIWITKFATEFAGQTSVGGLSTDIENIPIFSNLDESVAIGTIFDCSSNIDKNTYIIQNAEL